MNHSTFSHPHWKRAVSLLLSPSTFRLWKHFLELYTGKNGISSGVLGRSFITQFCTVGSRSKSGMHAVDGSELRNWMLPSLATIHSYICLIIYPKNIYWASTRWKALSANQEYRSEQSREGPCAHRTYYLLEGNPEMKSTHKQSRSFQIMLSVVKICLKTLAGNGRFGWAQVFLPIDKPLCYYGYSARLYMSELPG